MSRDAARIAAAAHAGLALEGWQRHWLEQHLDRLQLSIDEQQDEAARGEAGPPPTPTPPPLEHEHPPTPRHMIMIKIKSKSGPDPPDNW